MEKGTIIGIDLAKRVFQVHAASKDGRPVLRKKVSRAQLLGFLAKQPPCRRGDGGVRDGARLGTGD
jgi:transposase